MMITRALFVLSLLSILLLAPQSHAQDCDRVTYLSDQGVPRHACWQEIDRLNKSVLITEGWQFLSSDMAEVNYNSVQNSIEGVYVSPFESALWEISYWENGGEIAECRDVYIYEHIPRQDFIPQLAYSQCYRAWVPEDRRVEDGVEPQPYIQNRPTEALVEEAESDTDDLPPIRINPN